MTRFEHHEHHKSSDTHQLENQLHADLERNSELTFHGLFGDTKFGTKHKHHDKTPDDALEKLLDKVGHHERDGNHALIAAEKLLGHDLLGHKHHDGHDERKESQRHERLEHFSVKIAEAKQHFDLAMAKLRYYVQNHKSDLLGDENAQRRMRIHDRFTDISKHLSKIAFIMSKMPHA